MPNLKSSIYKIRSSLWDYPKYIFDEERSLFAYTYRLFNMTKPLSNIILFLLLFAISINLFPHNLAKTALAGFVKKNTFIEGVVVRPEDRPDNINPIFPTVNQLEKDLIELTSDKLLYVDNTGAIKPGIIRRWSYDREKNIYNFTIDQNAKWSDGEDITTKDIEFTINLAREYGADTLFGEIAKAINMDSQDNKNFTIRPTETIPTLIEAFTWEPLPKHILAKYTPNEIKRIPYNMNPVGSGPYIISKVTDNEITLEANKYYYLGTPKINQIRFLLFSNEEDLVNAIYSGKIMALNSISYESEEKILGNRTFINYTTNPIYQRYWSLYFNLSENGLLQSDKNLRKAISIGIDKNRIVREALEGRGEVMHGPIQKNSWAYDQEIESDQEYNLELANKLLDDGGYKVGDDGIRRKDDKPLSFDLYLINDENRIRIGREIKEDLLKLGIEVKLQPVDAEELINNVIAPKQFDLLLYGIETTIDPDHYRLWHSSQITFPGLNISSYKSSLTDGRTGKPRLDVMLVEARKTNNEKKRKEYYYDIQKLIMDDDPVVFLFHPQYNYIVSKRVKNINIEDISIPSERFRGVYNWDISTY